MKIAVEGQRLNEFVNREYLSNQVQGIVAEWNINPSDVCKILTSHFNGIGVFNVANNQAKKLRESIIHQLHFSQSIKDLRIKAQRDARLRTSSRHSV